MVLFDKPCRKAQYTKTVIREGMIHFQDTFTIVLRDITDALFRLYICCFFQNFITGPLQQQSVFPIDYMKGGHQLPFGIKRILIDTRIFLSGFQLIDTIQLQQIYQSKLRRVSDSLIFISRGITAQRKAKQQQTIQR